MSPEQSQKLGVTSVLYGMGVQRRHVDRRWRIAGNPVFPDLIAQHLADADRSEKGNCLRHFKYPSSQRVGERICSIAISSIGGILRHISGWLGRRFLR